MEKVALINIGPPHIW